jgi:homoserine kinase
MRVTVRVPATSANLGPGFDCLGLALDLCNEVVVDRDADPGVHWEGEGAAELPIDATDMVSRSMRLVAERLGRDLPPLSLRGRNAIPLERGLGSSAAASVAGVAAALALLDEDPDPAVVFQHAAEAEGHPDNAAAAVYGGLTIVAATHVERAEPHPSLAPVVLIPEAVRLPTAEARRVLPGRVPLADAVFNLQHTALTVLALTERPGALLEALQDRMHQDARLAMVPEVRETFESLRADGFPVCLSGAGPTLLVLAAEAKSRSVPDPGQGWRVLRVPPRRNGLEISVDR